MKIRAYQSYMEIYIQNSHLSTSLTHDINMYIKQ